MDRPLKARFETTSRSGSLWVNACQRQKNREDGSGNIKIPDKQRNLTNLMK